MIGADLVKLGYQAKLKRALDLILNDTPDNRDDTINAKLLDSLRAQLNANDDDGRAGLVAFLDAYIRERLFGEKADFGESSLRDRDADVTTFFFDLLGIFAEALVGGDATRHNAYMASLLSFIRSFLRDNFQDRFQMEPAIGCSVLQILVALMPHVDNSHQQEYYSEILDEVLFTKESLDVYLNNHCNSIYLRRSFKGLLRSYFVKLLNEWREQLDRGASEEPSRPAERISRVLRLLASLSHENRIDCLDLYCEVLVAVLASPVAAASSVSNASLVVLSFFYGQSEISTKASDHLFYWSSCINERSVDSFADVFMFEVVFEFLGQPDGRARQSLSQIFLDYFDATCVRFVATDADDAGQSALKYDQNASLFRKRASLLFRFLASAFTFFQKHRLVNSETPTCFSSIMASLVPSREELASEMDAISAKIMQNLLAPLSGQLNNSDSAVEESGSFRGFLCAESFVVKKLLIKQCLVNATLLLKRADGARFDLARFVDSNQLIYLLKHVELESEIKNALLDFLVAYYEPGGQTSTAAELDRLVAAFFDDFGLQLNDSISGQMLTLVAAALKTPGSSAIERPKLVQLLLSALKRHAATLDDEVSASKRARSEQEARDQPRLLAQLVLVVRFSLRLLDDPDLVALVVDLFRHSSFFVARKCLSSLTTPPAPVGLLEQTPEELDELRDLVYDLLSSFYSRLRAMGPAAAAKTGDLFESAAARAAFVRQIEEAAGEETEAFVRRQQIRFLSSYHLLALSTESAEMLATFDLFARFLGADFDWEVQLGCLAFFAAAALDVLTPPGLTLLLGASQFLPSLLPCSDDYDQHVVSAANQLIWQLKTNNRLHQLIIDLSSRFDELDEQLKVQGAAAAVVDKEARLQLLRQLADSSDADELAAKAALANQTSDLYLQNPSSVLDDIISSYQFDLDDEKAVDCY